MSVTQVSGRHIRMSATLEGVVLNRSKSRSRRHGVSRVELVGWDKVLGATVHTTRSGRPVVRLSIVGRTAPDHHRDDPFSVKLPSDSTSVAQEFVDYVDVELAVRRRWQSLA